MTAVVGPGKGIIKMTIIHKSLNGTNFLPKTEKNRRRKKKKEEKRKKTKKKNPKRKEKKKKETNKEGSLFDGLTAVDASSIFSY